MGFTKKDNIYKITRITGNHDSFLGISFAEKIEQNPEINEVLKQVLAGLKSVNQSLGTNYKLSQIYYEPSSDGPILIHRLIIHYHNVNEFDEA